MKSDARIEISAGLDLTGRLIEWLPGLMTRLGRLETRVLAQDLDDVRIDSPVFVTGLARSGSTILLEILDRHAETGSHRYRDFPAVAIPYFWNWFIDRAAPRPAEPEERAHKDGILVSSESPEAMEEAIWMLFFPDCHNPRVSQQLTEACDREDFESFYRAHIRKLLYVRRSSRYLSKANYHVSRLRYLKKLFPDARFVIPVREPVAHVASLMKQHELFVREERRDPRILKHMNRAGHFEFGLNRTAINFGNGQRTKDVERLWQEDELKGWARYWSDVYSFIADQIGADAELAESTLIVRFEELCSTPAETLDSLFAHCKLSVSKSQLAELATIPRAPTYYQPRFAAAEQEFIVEETQCARSAMGYPDLVTDAAG